MTQTKNTTNADTAKEALDAVHTASSEGLQAAMPPRWFGLAISLITGGLVAAASAGETELIAVMLAAMVGVMAMRRGKSSAEPKAMPSSFIGVIAMLGLLLFGLAMMAGGRFLAEAHGLVWAPIAGGGAFALVVYLLSLSERREYRARIEGNDDQ